MHVPSKPAGQACLNRWLGRAVASPLFWGVLLVSGLAVRVRQYLFLHSYWYDEAFLVIPIRERGYADLLGAQPYNLVIPPVFLWITRLLYLVGGDSEWLMRLPAFLAGIAALFLMVPLARKVVGNGHAVWAVVWLVVCRKALSHGCEVRPYTVDLLVLEWILYCVLILIDPVASRQARRWAGTGLGVAAALGPWISFPSVFTLAAAGLALGTFWGRPASRRAWIAWAGFLGTAGLSIALLWWCSARHMNNYVGMIEHWGHRGWGGFPDWSQPLAIGKWLLGRPVCIGNYGNREIGIVLTLLALWGSYSLARRARAVVVLLVAPGVLAVAAALAGKYPVADRTTFFLLPCLWLLAACGMSRLVAWGQQRGWDLAFLGLVLLSVDLTSMVGRLVQPDGHLDYRGAYQFVLAHRQPMDLLWSQFAVVYQTYYGTAAPVLRDNEFEQAVQQVNRQRLWVVVGNRRPEVRQRLEAAGGCLVHCHHVSGLDVLLFEPGRSGSEPRLVQRPVSCPDGLLNLPTGPRSKMITSGRVAD